MKKGLEPLPLCVRRHIKGVLEWIKTQEAKDYVDVSTVSAILTPLLKHMPPPIRNPLVLISYDYDGYYGYFQKRYIVSLVEYVVIALSKPTFYYSEEVGKHTKVEANVEDFIVTFADEEDELRHGVDAYRAWNFKGNYAPRYSYEAIGALWEVFESKTPAYNVEEDVVPNPEEFASLIDQTLAPFPKKTVLKWPEYLPNKLDLHLHFADARMAALFVQNAPKISYYLASNQEKRYDVDISTFGSPKVCFEDDSYGVDAAKFWTCDPLQWDQMQKECATRASWDEMLRVAQSVIRQKRLKV